MRFFKQSDSFLRNNQVQAPINNALVNNAAVMPRQVDRVHEIKTVAPKYGEDVLLAEMIPVPDGHVRKIL